MLFLVVIAASGELTDIMALIYHGADVHGRQGFMPYLPIAVKSPNFTGSSHLFSHKANPLTMAVVDSKNQPINSIILADDDRDDHDFLKDALVEIAPSATLSIVENGDELLALLKHYVPDFIFLDLDMPCKNGLECLTEIRSNTMLRDIPIVIFSSTSRPANIDTAYEMGADLFFIKPHNYNDLVASVKAIFSLNWSQPSAVKEQYFINGRYAAFM